MSPETLLQDLLVTEICKYLKFMNIVKRQSHIERERETKKNKGPIRQAKTRDMGYKARWVWGQKLTKR